MLLISWEGEQVRGAQALDWTHLLVWCLAAWPAGLCPVGRGLVRTLLVGGSAMQRKERELES